MIFRNYKSSELVINFWANGKAQFHNLSNFALISDGIEYGGIIYPSTEQAFQAQKYVENQRPRFSVTGDLSVWYGLKLLYKPDEYESKYNYWAKKNNIGIVAKISTNENNGK